MFKAKLQDVSDLKKSLRLTNFVAAASLYLKNNFWLENKLNSADIKERIIGHWGTVPGLNLVYAGLNWLNFNLENGGNVGKVDDDMNSKHSLTDEILNSAISPNKMLLVVGPGHGAPAILSNLWLEGSLEKYYPKYSADLKGAENLIKNFSWPSGFPSHTYPGLPGSINEGGELGYSLGLAFGSIIDKPNLVTVCVVGDGEAETGALAASWQSNKFVNFEKDGAVLPILHLNDYKISGPTIYSRMSDESLFKYFEGLNYQPFLVTQNYPTSLTSNHPNFEKEDEWLKDYLDTLALCYEQILNYKAGKTSKLPVLLLRTLKGWTGPKFAGGAKIEGNNLSHGIPLKSPKNNKIEFELLQNWLESYKVHELINVSNNQIKSEIIKLLPSKINRLGLYQETLFKACKSLNFPDFKDIEINTLVRGQNGNQLVHLSKFLKEVISENPNNFRVFSPDESESNRLEDLFNSSNRVFNLPLKEWDDNLGAEGQIMEMLSEQTLQSWMQGYAINGGHGILFSYEAFLAIIISQIDQYIKYSKQCLEFPWRGERPSMNYFATSTAWRQDHNGFTHQNPILINTLLSKHVNFTNVYFPVDVNTGLNTLEKALDSNNTVNLIVAGKTELPQWLNTQEAKTQVQQGIMEWEFARSDHASLSNNKALSSEENKTDIVLASAGDYQTLETMAAITWLKENAPELNFKYVNINQATCFGLGNVQSSQPAEELYAKTFPKDVPILINFHGYPEALKQILYSSSLASRTEIIGYAEHGTTTTPFDMQVLNGTSRFHVAIKALEIASERNAVVAEKSRKLIQTLNAKLIEHSKYIVEHGQDLPEVIGWKWVE
jgi:xylulose-5-phosphate/fructose-6-phosphate phosphoketolase